MHPFRGTLAMGIIWLLVVGAVYVAFQHWSDREAHPNRVLTVAPAGEITLQRNRAGQYVAEGEINGTRVTFLLDTGATHIAIPARLARELKLKLGPPITIQTAAGSAPANATRLDSVRLAGIEMRDMAALVSEGLDPGMVLLGMNFLKRLEITQRGDQLMLKPLPPAQK